MNAGKSLADIILDENVPRQDVVKAVEAAINNIAQIKYLEYLDREQAHLSRAAAHFEDYRIHAEIMATEARNQTKMMRRIAEALEYHNSLYTDDPEVDKECEKR